MKWIIRRESADGPQYFTGQHWSTKISHAAKYDNEQFAMELAKSMDAHRVGVE